MTKKYALGIDFGSLSARAMLFDLTDGSEAAGAVHEYAHAVIDTELAGQPLPPDWALQHPQDYIDALQATVRAVLHESGIDPGDIAGVGVDFTACTVLPIFEDGTPLCFAESYADNPHAYVKMWKSHGAQAQAERLLAIAKARGEKFLDNYSGQISSEWMLPKVWQILEEAPEVYDAMDRFIEAGDWIVMLLTGSTVRSASQAGYKALWSSELGYPSREFLSALDERLADFPETKLQGEVLPLGRTAGYVNAAGAALTGLAEGTPVAVSVIDAHAAMPAAGVTGAGKLMMMMGTSNCLLLLSRSKCLYRGICGAVKNGMEEGYYGYEAGQACAGDHFDWFVKNCMPHEYVLEAERLGVSRHAYLRSLCENKRPGETGLLALDWWNGVRSDLMDEDLSGLLVGMTLNTKAEDIYRALIESVAFGARVVADNYETAGVPFDEIYACGGVAYKDPMMMQIFADVIGKPIYVIEAKQAAAKGAAMFAAVAGGCFENLDAAAKALVKPPVKTYTPNPEYHEIYSELFAMYLELHDAYGVPGSLIKRLRALRRR